MASAPARRAALAVALALPRAACVALAPAFSRAVCLAVALALARAASLALAVALALAGASAADAARAEPARRIVSLNPSLTAILLALGARDALVGVDSFSAKQEPAVAELPTVGGLYNPSLEAVVALDPDLVVFVPTAEQRGFQQRLEELALPIEPFDPVSFDDVLRSIERLGARVGREAAARERIAAIRAARRAVEARVAGLPRRRTVLVLQREPLFVVGRGSFVDEMLAAAGAENVGRSLGEVWPRATLEWLLAAAPELIIDASDVSHDAATYWARWPSLPAVRDGRVVSLPQGAVALPGPWLDRALERLAAAIHPEASERAGPSPTAVVRPAAGPAPGAAAATRSGASERGRPAAADPAPGAAAATRSEASERARPSPREPAPGTGATQPAQPAAPRPEPAP